MSLNPQPASLKQLLAPLNAIMQRLAVIDERQAGQSQQPQHPRDFSYFNFLQHNPIVHQDDRPA
jgi:hypothetical protein